MEASVHSQDCVRLRIHDRIVLDFVENYTYKLLSTDTIEMRGHDNVYAFCDKGRDPV